MYIPPEGAMQFEFTTSRSVALQPFVGIAFWVDGKPVTHCTDVACSCRPKWFVIAESLPAEMKRLVDYAAARSGRQFSVCACNGRLIE